MGNLVPIELQSVEIYCSLKFIEIYRRIGGTPRGMA